MVAWIQGRKEFEWPVGMGFTYPLNKGFPYPLLHFSYSFEESLPISKNAHSAYFAFVEHNPVSAKNENERAMNANGQLIEQLTRPEMYQTYEHAYTEATGLPLTFRPLQTWQIPLHGKRMENPFCELMTEQRSACAACLQMQEKLAKEAMGEPATIICSYGLYETAVPVKLGSNTIGFLQTGQVMRQKPTNTSFRRAVDQAKRHGVDLNTPKAKEAYFQTPVVSQKKLDSLSALLTIFADHISMKSNQLAVQSATAEPLMITRAKQYILENYAEKLSLGQVAGAVHTSRFYFCKIFRKLTGLTFTEFVSRTRIEKAKDLLLNPNLRVSEIAFGVGFQSLTHFNRVFRKTVGEAPTTYRDRLPKAA